MAKSKGKKQKDLLPEQFDNVEEAVEFWDTHSLADYEESWKDVQCEIDVKRRRYQVSLDGGLYQNLRRAARARGVSADTLVNSGCKKKYNGPRFNQHGYVAGMKSRKKPLKKQLTEEEIDEIVESQADDDSAWGKPIQVRRAKDESLARHNELAAGE